MTSTSHIFKIYYFCTIFYANQNLILFILRDKALLYPF